MTPTVRIDDEVYEFIKKHAEPFVDSPNDVLRRLLRLDGSASPRIVANHREGNRQDRVRAIVEEVVKRDPDMELLESDRVRIHFAPRAWTAPELMRGSTKSGRILWFGVTNRPTKLRLYLEICPGDQDTRRRIRESLQNQPWFSAAGRQLSPMWHRISRKYILLPRDYEIHGDDMDWIANKINEVFADFKANDFPKIDKAVRAIKF